jgi:hypothetical protein
MSMNLLVDLLVALLLVGNAVYTLRAYTQYDGEPSDREREHQQIMKYVRK